MMNRTFAMFLAAALLVQARTALANGVHVAGEEHALPLWETDILPMAVVLIVLLTLYKIYRKGG